MKAVASELREMHVKSLSKNPPKSCYLITNFPMFRLFCVLSLFILSIERNATMINLHLLEM